LLQVYPFLLFGQTPRTWPAHHHQTGSMTTIYQSSKYFRSCTLGIDAMA
jgi:hypothetical protein